MCDRREKPQVIKSVCVWALELMSIAMATTAPPLLCSEMEGRGRGEGLYVSIGVSLREGCHGAGFEAR